MSETPEITPEMVANYNQRMAEETRRQVEEASRQIVELATSLGVRIVASAQAVEVAPGTWAMSPVVAIEKVK